jgi:hypothetical protein
VTRSSVRRGIPGFSRRTGNFSRMFPKSAVVYRKQQGKSTPCGPIPVAS